MNKYLKYIIYCIVVNFSACELPDNKLCERAISETRSVHIYQEQTVEDASMIYYYLSDESDDTKTEKIFIASSADELDSCDMLTVEHIGNLCYITLFDSRDVYSVYDISSGRHTHIWPSARDLTQKHLNDSLFRELLEQKPHLRRRY